MVRKNLLLFISLMMPMFIFGDTYTSLWKKVSEADAKDQPKTEYDIIQQIVKKATDEKAYGQLLKAELKGAQVMAEIAPDSLKPAMERMRERSEAMDDEVLKTVYQTVLYCVNNKNSSLGLNVKKPELTDALCQKLAAVKDETYRPFVITGFNAEIFDNDLLNIIGRELGELRPLYDYYVQTGNRRAACIIASKTFAYQSIEKLDELIRLYQDLPEAGELAMVRFDRMYTATAGEKVAYIHEALDKWGSWKRMDQLRNKESELINPQYHISYDHQVVMPQQSQEITLKDLRNISSLKLKVYKVRANGDLKASPDYEEGYKKIKPLLTETGIEVKREYTGKEPYDIFDDTMTLQDLPVGVYMLEFSTTPATEVMRKLYYVTDVYTIMEDQPTDEGVRYVVVSARTGQPIRGAHLRIKEYVTYSQYETKNGVTDEQGEYILKSKPRIQRREVFAYTDTDKACPEMNLNNRYSYYGEKELVMRTNIYTDRSIYRPGQTVHASALIYQVEGGMDQSVCGSRTVIFRLRDANYKIIEEKEAKTDDYGACAVDFSLPSSGLTGSYTIQVNDVNDRFRVEEYKRPTFHVDFPEVTQAYGPGDTLKVKGTAMSYAGVPVQEANVTYKVVRRTAFWWWSYSRYWDTATIGYGNEGVGVSDGEAVTDKDGNFEVEVLFELPETSYPMFYTFVVTADVTDSAGETHSGELSLPIGNRKKALTVDLQEKILLDDQPQFTFHLLNAAGKDIDGGVRYQIDGGKWQTAKTNQQLSLSNGRMKSGKHTLEAVCEGDTLKREFVLFSLDDQVPATETKDWFYQSATQFPNDGTPVTVQVGSSDEDVHIVYSLFSGNQLLERGTVDKSNALLNRKLIYKEEYGHSVVMTFAWVKENQCYTHVAKIQRPLPDKKLRLKWTTFRDRLKPGQQEEWTLTVKDADGKPVDAQLMATLYDQSLDQLSKHQWSLVPYLWLPLPDASWSFVARYRVSFGGSLFWKHLNVADLRFSRFDESVFPSPYGYYHFSRGMMGSLTRAKNGMVLESMAMMDEAPAPKLQDPVAMKARETVDADEAEPEAETSSTETVQVRENLNETAFFYPQLTTDENGCVALKFTLPESLTTWRFMGLAHTRDMYYGMIEGEAVTQKDVMIQPNVPRFLRADDQGTIAARIFNTGEKDLGGKAILKLINPETQAVVYEHSQDVMLSAGGTTTVAFDVAPQASGIADYPLLICQMIVSGQDFSDGEQHYLPILPSTERVIVTVPITQHHAGMETVDLTALIPADSRQPSMTVEYTNNPVWLMVQALPALGSPAEDNAISLAASFYANSLGKHIISQYPQAKVTFDLWKRETGSETTLMSALEKNQELKEIVLSETPWVMDADNETKQKQRMADFFDDNLMQDRIGSVVGKLKKLQRGDGSWSWWPDMPGSFYMTVAISEMLVRLNDMAGTQEETAKMLSNAFDFMGDKIVEEVKEMKKCAKKGHKPSFPSFKSLQWLYLVTIDGRELPNKVVEANNYLLPLLKKEIKNQSMYEKALTAVILTKTDPKRAAEYVQSLKEYTVYREDMGRYYDTPRATYSWYDYKIPTQTVAIEAMQRITPDDRQTIMEMQRWLLQEKRTQAWDTPINSVNAVYAFLLGKNESLSTSENAVLKIDGEVLEIPQATAAIGYVKTSVPSDSKTFTVEKTSDGTSWGAVYVQFTQRTSNIADNGSGIIVKRELLSADGKEPTALKVGDRVTVRITIITDRDYDFVQVIDKRAACMEPVRQLSGYRYGYYCTPKDNTTNYYIDMMSKGEHIIENQYFIDRVGTYETGTCTVQCAYAPEFHAVTKSETLKIEK